MGFLYNSGMKGLLVHGCYDQATFRTLEALGVDNFAFDLRARSTQLITFKELKEILAASHFSRTVLMFSDDSKETILSSIDLLKHTGKSFLLEYRDKRSAESYEKVGLPYLWYFSPDADWKNVLKSSLCEGIILPLRYQSLYHDLPYLWTILEERNLPIYLHAETFEEASFFEGKDDILASLDLSAEVQVSYRNVDQLRLRTMKLWRKFNESPAGQ